MSQKTINNKPLGAVLQEAGLVSAAQIQVVLQDQLHQTHLRVGDILELRGWVKRDAIEFFAEEWPKVADFRRDEPIGYYFQQAGLLSSEQVDELLKEQSRAGMRIGALAVLRGWLSQKTLDCFLQHLAPEDYGSSSFIKQSQPRSSHSVHGDQVAPSQLTENTSNTQNSQQIEAPADPSPDNIRWVD